jgi:hypothetical protein
LEVARNEEGLEALPDAHNIGPQAAEVKMLREIHWAGQFSCAIFSKLGNCAQVTY